jgi:large conductance mechanosensitive channel
VLAWGNFLTVLINFLIIAWVLFLVIRGINRLVRSEAEKPAKPAEAPRQEVLLQEIRDILASKPARPA